MKDEYSFDTSVILRLLTQAPDDQYSIASSFLKEKLAADTTVEVSDLVLAEAYFALQTYYGMPKNKALEALALFSKHSGVTVSLAAASVLQIPNLSSAKPGFIDRLIHGESQQKGRWLVTFEKAAKKLPATQVLSIPTA